MENQSYTQDRKRTCRVVEAGNINIKQGIFQGDSLSPLLFCMALFPLSKELKEAKTGYIMKKNQDPINHLFYVDDLKLFANNDKNLEKLLDIVKTFSDDIKMSFGLEKCAKVTIEKGKIKKRNNIQLNDSNTIIRELEGHEIYKYLGMEENTEIEHTKMKEKITRQYYSRIRKILKSELTGKNKFIAISTLAVPVLNYSFEILNWKLSEIQKIDRKTRKQLTMNNLHNPNADIDRLYVPREKGGRGLMNLEDTFKLAIIGTAKYISSKNNDRLISILNEFETNRESERTILKNADKYKREFLQNEDSREITETENVNEEVKKLKSKCKANMTRRREEKWSNKVMHGQHARQVKEENINREMSYSWLKNGDLKGETESVIVAAQDQAITTNYIKAKIHKEKVDSKCRLCHQYDETIKHIISGCPILASKEYTERHNKVGQNLHHSICKHYNINVEENWYKHEPKSVETNEKDKVTILWDMQIQTDRTIGANKPDIVIKDLTRRECIIIDVAIPYDGNVIEKEAEKRLKYKDLQIEVQRMWGLKCVVIPVVIGATGTISKNFNAYLKQIPGIINQHKMNRTLQNSALLGTAHIIRKIL